MVYPALLPLMHTTPLPAVEWTGVPRRFNPLALELDIYSLAHHLCKSKVIRESPDESWKILSEVLEVDADKSKYSDTSANEDNSFRNHIVSRNLR